MLNLFRYFVLSEKINSLYYSARQKVKLKPGTSPWPPFRNPSECGSAYEDPRKILKSKVFHAVALVVLYKAIRGHVSEHVMALLVFLLEQAIIVSDKTPEDDVSCLIHLFLYFLFYIFANLISLRRCAPAARNPKDN